MDKLLPLLLREFPDFDPAQAFEAGIPVYYTRLAIEVLEPQKLTSFQSYFLHAVALGVNTQEKLAHLLGLEETDLLAPGASLLKLEYIQQGLPVDGERPISLTNKGHQALSENPPPVPKRKTASMHFNALTWIPIPLEDDTFSVDLMCKEGYFILPGQQKTRPTLGDYTEKDVASALSDDSDFQDNVVTELLELKRVELQYIAPVTVVLLQHRETREERLAVYRNSVQLRSESAAVQQLYDLGKLTLPSEIAFLNAPVIDLPIPLPAAVADTTRSLARTEYDLANLEAELQVQETTQSDDTGGHDLLLERIRQLKEELSLKRQEGEQYRELLTQSQITFLSTEEHRPFLEQALREATNEILIISPWMNRRTCNDEICKLVGAAIGRGVYIHIGYGIGKERDAREAERNHQNMKTVRREFERWMPKDSPGRLIMRETSGTHQKILVCDRVFAITGSFNWLSYAGQKDEGYRKETGTLHRLPQQVEELASIALQSLSS